MPPRKRAMHDEGVLRLVSRANWWLRTPNGTNATNVCNVNNNGNANNNSAANTNIRPLP